LQLPYRQTFPALLPHKLKCASLWQTRVFVQPGEKTADAGPDKRDAGVGRSVIKIDGISVRVYGLSARKDDIINVSDTFIRGFWSEYPGIPAL
jgi:hypothetical protein